MKHLLFVPFIFCCLTAVGQAEYCLEGTVWDEEQGGCVIDEEYCGWQPDGNGDNLIGINDLLALLAVYGDIDYDGDGVWDSVDDCVGFYDAVGVCNGNCDVDEDGDGFCDDVDDCVGEYDECGICNGGGVPLGKCDCLGNTLDECGFCGGPGPDEFGDCCGSPFYYEGHHYPTVKIGNQCWFAENLRNENYANGDAIPTNLSESQWIATLEGAVAVYGEEYGGDSECENLLFYEIDACNPSVSLEEWGRLYNAYAVVDLRGLCPSGWHVPSDGEWTAMTDYLGGASVAGKKIKATSGWSVDNSTNSSGFTGLPGGILAAGSTLEINFGAGTTGFWWSSTPGSAATSGSDNFQLKHRYAYGLMDYLYSSNFSQNRGYSVRCIKDAE